MRRLVRQIVVETGVGRPLPDLPDGVEALVRETADEKYLFLLNHGDDPVALSAPAGGVPLVGNATALAPRDVAVLRLPRGS